MAMENLDQKVQEKAEIMASINKAMKDGDEEAFAAAFAAYTEMLQQAVMAEAKGLVQTSDNQILAGRGVRVLTAEETKYYQKLIEAMTSPTPKQALSNFDEVLPKTVIETIFEDIVEDHPLLSLIDFQNAGALIEFLYSTMDARHKATWGPLCSTITEQLSASFARISLGQNKLSAWIPVCKAMLDLGPAWLDRYVRTILFESVANGLEDGIINGRGIAEGASSEKDYIYEPIGMTRDMASASFDLATGYAEKDPVSIESFSPQEYGALIAQLCISPNNLYRTVPGLVLVVNPVDYYSKVMPATTYLNPNGTYVSNVFPHPTTVVQSAYVEEGKAALGVGKRYFFALGTAKGGKIEYSDEYQFLEDYRTYLIKLYGNGKPKDNNSFLVLDISQLAPILMDVNVANTPLDVYSRPVIDARLSSLKFGALDLAPDFNKSIFAYDVDAASASTTKVTAVAKDGDATIVIAGDGTATVAADGTVTWNWDTGKETRKITITVTSGAESETYTVTAHHGTE